MSWEVTLLLLFGGLVLLMFLGMPVAFSFMTVNLVTTYLLFGRYGINQLVLNMYDSIKSFVLVPIPMFILMGELLFRSGLVNRGLNALSQWLGRLPGRLSVLALMGGTVFAAASGSSLANTAMLSSSLLRDMLQRRYSKLMSAGPILAAGSLAMIIPPSSMAVILGAIGNISIGKLLIAGIVPGILMALVSIGYIIIRCWLDPSLAPAYEVELAPFRRRIYMLARDILPIGFLVFLVIGLLFLGVATPSESAALGAVGGFLLALLNGRLTASVLRESLLATVRVTGMILLIMAGAAAYGYLLASTGATRAMIEAVLSLKLPPLAVIAAMQLAVLLLGGPLDQISILMVTMPIFMPIVNALGFDPVWFGILMLINLDLANLTPPLGLTLYVVKAAAPEDFTMEEVTRSAVPFIILDIAVMALLMAFPGLVTWLPNRAR